MIKLLLTLHSSNWARRVDAINHITLVILNENNLFVEEHRLLVVGNSISESNRNESLTTLVKSFHSVEVSGGFNKIETSNKGQNIDSNRKVDEVEGIAVNPNEVHCPNNLA